QIKAVGDQAAFGCEIPKRIDGRQVMPRRQYDDRSTVRVRVAIRRDDEAAIGLAGKGSDRALNPACVKDVHGRHGDAERWRDRLGRAQQRYSWTGVRTEQHSSAAQVGYRLLEHSQPLAAHRGLEGMEARDIASGPRETRHKSAVDWVADLDEHDRDRGGQPLKLG